MGLAVQHHHCFIQNTLHQTIRDLFFCEGTAGSYSVRFDGSKLTSGTYVARLTSDGKTQTKKLMLIK
jgi:hypothetical protein